MNEHDPVGDARLQRHIVNHPKKTLIAGLRIFQRGFDGVRRGISPVINRRRVIELEEIRQRAVLPVKIRAGCIGKMQKAHRHFAAITGGDCVAQLQIKLNAETVVRRECPAQRMMEIAVGLRRIPGHDEILVCGIPVEQVCVAENLPAVERRVGGKSFDKGVGAGGRGGQNEQAGDGQ